jgi:hypothetical protein
MQSQLKCEWETGCPAPPEEPKTLLPGLNSCEVVGLARTRQRVKKVVAGILFLKLLVILIPRVRIGYSFAPSLFHSFTLSEDLQGGDLSETYGESVCLHLC